MNFRSNLFSVSLSSLLGGLLVSTKDLVVSVLLLSSLLSRWLLWLLRQAVSDQSVVWFESLSVSDGAVDQTETGRLSSTELGSETEDGNSVLLGFVDFSQLFSQLILGDIWSVWVQDIDDELSSGQQWVGNNLTSSDGNGVTLDLLV